MVVVLLLTANQSVVAVVLTANRFKRYLDDDFFEHQIHWFSIFNSFMMVLFLVSAFSSPP